MLKWVHKSHKSKHFVAVIKDVLCCLWGHLGIHFIHLNHTCELGWSEPTVEAAHVSHTRFSACLLFAVLSQEHTVQEDLFACLV